MVSGQPHAPDAYAPTPITNTYGMEGWATTAQYGRFEEEKYLQRNADVTTNSNTVQIQYLILYHRLYSKIICA
jgi:hypothetical protein